MVIGSTSADVRKFYRDWSDGIEKKANGEVLEVPLNLENAFLAGYNTYFNEDRCITDSRYKKGSGEHYFFMAGYARGFNEHLFPKRITR